MLHLTLHHRITRDISHATNSDGTPCEAEVAHIVSTMDPFVRDAYLQPSDGHWLVIDADTDASVGIVQRR